jgi:hypothetical protein
LRQAKILTALNERLRLEPHSCLNRTRIFSDGRQQLPRHCTKSPAHLACPGVLPALAPLVTSCTAKPIRFGIHSALDVQIADAWNWMQKAAARS